MKLHSSCCAFCTGEEISFMVFSLIANFSQSQGEVSKLEIDLKKESASCLP